jgi:hypothetical protein
MISACDSPPGSGFFDFFAGWPRVLLRCVSRIASLSFLSFITAVAARVVEPCFLSGDFNVLFSSKFVDDFQMPALTGLGIADVNMSPPVLFVVFQ